MESTQETNSPAIETEEDFSFICNALQYTTTVAIDREGAPWRNLNRALAESGMFRELCESHFGAAQGFEHLVSFAAELYASGWMAGAIGQASPEPVFKHSRD